MSELAEHLREIISSLSTATPEVKTDFLSRVQKGNLLRNEDPLTHFCVFFVPYIRSEKKVFMGHHTKAASWIAPGGHIEPGHTIPEETVIQEAREELGIEITKERISTPFYLSAFDVFAPNRACQRHYSIWYFIPFEKEEQFTIEEREFFATKWISLADVHTLKTNTENLEAIEVLKTL